VPNDNEENWFTVRYEEFTPKEIVVMGGRKSRKSRKSKKRKSKKR
jgi:hypothetical protein